MSPSLATRIALGTALALPNLLALILVWLSLSANNGWFDPDLPLGHAALLATTILFASCLSGLIAGRLLLSAKRLTRAAAGALGSFAVTLACALAYLLLPNNQSVVGPLDRVAIYWPGTFLVASIYGLVWAAPGGAIVGSALPVWFRRAYSNLGGDHA